MDIIKKKGVVMRLHDVNQFYKALVVIQLITSGESDVNFNFYNFCISIPILKLEMTLCEIRSC